MRTGASLRPSRSTGRRPPPVRHRPGPRDDEAARVQRAVIQRVDLTAALSVFLIQPDRLPSRVPWFTAGQYCVLGLNNDERPDLGSVRRSMSIASAPEDEGPLEFYIRRIGVPKSNNPLTHLMWALKRGDRLTCVLSAPASSRIEDTIGSSDERLRVLVAAGTGIAPFVSMIRSEVRRNPRADLSRWAVLHGASYPEELGIAANSSNWRRPTRSGTGQR